MKTRTQQEHDEDVAEIAEGAGIIARAAVAELRDAGMWASPAQWARARALSDANDWVTAVVCGGIGFDPHHMQITPDAAQHIMEALAERWAAWIESGEMPA